MGRSKASNPDLLIIGGGASGLMAAIAAARHGARVTVLDRMDRVGKKLLATGNGRCNLTNVNCTVRNYHGQDAAFALHGIGQFPPAAAREFFESLGLLTYVEEGGRVYPLCGQASAVLDVMRFEVQRLGVSIFCSIDVQRALRSGGGFQVRTRQGQEYSAGRLLLACGGKAAPNLGSNGSGYELARQLGHSCVEPFAALVQLNCSSPFLTQIDGVRWNGAATLRDGNGALRQEIGELQFTSFGLSGIPILQLSRIAAERLQRNLPVYLDIDLFPAYQGPELEAHLIARLQRWPEEPLETGLVGMLHKRLIGPIVRSAGIDDVRMRSGRLGRGEISRLAQIMRQWRFAVTGTQPWMRAQVSAGGVATSEIDPHSMASRIVPGLCFAGELVDIDGDCGGYNLQWAWASGHVAGTHAARAEA